jgi:hypothetical protein
VIDALLHLPAKFNREILIFDWIFHAIVEQNLFEFAGKLMRYDLPRLLAELLRKRSLRRIA